MQWTEKCHCSSALALERPERKAGLNSIASCLQDVTYVLLLSPAEDTTQAVKRNRKSVSFYFEMTPHQKTGVPLPNLIFIPSAQHLIELNKEGVNMAFNKV